MAGPHSVMRTPNLLSKWMLERATRLCRMSPRMVTIPAFELAFAVADGERVEQSLRGMFVRAVAGVQHGNFQALGDEFGRAGGAVADDDAVGPHGLERAHGVDAAIRPFSGWRIRPGDAIVSAPRRAAAVVKLMRVRVEASKKAMATVLPRSVASFFSGWRWNS